MNEEHATQTPEQKQRLARIRREALALRHVLNAGPEERQDRAEALNNNTLELVGLVAAVARAIRNAPSLTLQDLEPILDRDNLKTDAEALMAANVNPLEPVDPDQAADAYEQTLADTAQAVHLRKIDEARRLLDDAERTTNISKQAALMEDAARRIEQAEREMEVALEDAWNTHLESIRGEAVKPGEAVMLDAKRRNWAGWFNQHLGPRGGLTPGRTMVLGGGPAGGKTSLAACLAVDAMEDGCPVLFWQLELSREETLEHLMAQNPRLKAWGKDSPKAHHERFYWDRVKNPLPECWRDLLTVPRWPTPDAESIERALYIQARKTERARKAGTMKHACNGLVIVDYTQLMTMAAKGPKDAGHEVLATAASRLAKAAGETGAVLVLLSQLTKEAQREAATVAGTSYHGADLARMAHCAVTICRASLDKNEKLKPAPANERAHNDPQHGEARLMTWTKTRGTYRLPPDYLQPPGELEVWYKNRALHGGTDTVNIGKLIAKAGGTQSEIWDDDEVKE